LGSAGGGVTAVGNAGIVTTGMTFVIMASVELRGWLRGACAGGSGIWTGWGADTATTASAVFGTISGSESVGIATGTACSSAEAVFLFGSAAGVEDRFSDAALAAVPEEGLPNIERIIASAVCAGVVAIPCTGVFEFDGATAGGVSAA
jgi:hypothetical protein